MTSISKRLAIAAVSILGIGASVVRAEAKLPAFFADHMVIQRDVADPVWGWAQANEKVTVAFDDQAQTTSADGKGRWMVKLKPVGAGGPHKLSVRGESGQPKEIADILVGEVWVCSGQSNMGFELFESKNGKEEVAAADYPQIRLFKVPRKGAAEPQDDVKAVWKICGPKTAWDFSAVAYFFGRDLYQKLNVPIGLIDTAYGGTPAEAWTSMEDLSSRPELKMELERRDSIIAAYPEKKAKFDKVLAEWDKEHPKPTTQEAKAKPKAPEGADGAHVPTALWNAMIHPLIPYGIRGAIWYQGESNANRAMEYRTLFPTMIQGWRKAWGSDFPFLYVQLTGFFSGNPPATQPRDSYWAELREAQSMTLSTPNTGMAVIIDIGEERDIHPKNKQDVGKRLALIARAKVYGEKVEDSGPVYKSMKVEGNAIRLTFDHAEDGLVMKETTNADHAFAIAGPDHRFVWAQGKVDGDSVVVSSPEVSDPAAVRYAWDYVPPAVLFNKAGLPASPFRTDDWPTKVMEPKK